MFFRAYVAALTVLLVGAAPAHADRADRGVEVTVVDPAPRPPIDFWQNRLWWFGESNPNPPEQTEVLTFYPLALVPELLRPVFEQLLARVNFEACVLGATVQFGPYGATKFSYSRGCA